MKLQISFVGKSLKSIMEIQKKDETYKITWHDTPDTNEIYCGPSGD